MGGGEGARFDKFISFFFKYPNENALILDF